jgi:hypothetical protein
LVGLTVAIYSCSKDDAVHQNEKKPFMTERNLEINRLITSFKGKMADIRKNPTAKNDEIVSADSALWYLEATINYSHGFPNEYYQEFTTDSLSLTIEKISDGEVNLTELTAKYDQMKSDVAAVYHASDYEDKGLTVIDLSKTSETDSEITISVRSTIGKINPNPDTLKTDIPEDWYYGEDEGFCVASGGDGDASEQIRDKIDILLANAGKQGSFFVGLQEVEVQGGDPTYLLDSNSEPDNHLDYYLYYSIEGSSIPFYEDMKCIPDADMDAYKILVEELLYDFIPQYLLEEFGLDHHTLMFYEEFKDDKTIDNINEIYTYFHYGKFFYGEDAKYSSGNSPVEIQ